MTAITARACAKINLSLRVLRSRPDGYHDLRTTFQSIALHDVLTFTAVRGPFEIECDDPACPAGRDNIVRKAAARLWRAAGRSGSPTGVRVRIEKRIPMAAGLGGGSADAAAALRALAVLWRVRSGEPMMHATAAALGADVPFFLEGGTALGVERGDVLVPLPDQPPRWVVLVVPSFGVSTRDAYGWFDEARAARPARERDSAKRARHRRPFDRFRIALSHVEGRAGVGLCEKLRNDLQAPVVEHHREIGRIVSRLTRSGAGHAAMTGSGSAVYGLFSRRSAADAAADALVGGGRRAIVTRTLARRAYRRMTGPVLARK